VLNAETLMGSTAVAAGTQSNLFRAFLSQLDILDFAEDECRVKKFE
jgi:hypothetical protein